MGGVAPGEAAGAECVEGLGRDDWGLRRCGWRRWAVVGGGRSWPCRAMGTAPGTRLGPRGSWGGRGGEAEELGGGFAGGLKLSGEEFGGGMAGVGLASGDGLELGEREDAGFGGDDRGAAVGQTLDGVEAGGGGGSVKEGDEVVERDAADVGDGGEVELACDVEVEDLGLGFGVECCGCFGRHEGHDAGWRGDCKRGWGEGRGCAHGSGGSGEILPPSRLQVGGWADGERTDLKTGQWHGSGAPGRRAGCTMAGLETPGFRIPSTCPFSSRSVYCMA